MYRYQIYQVVRMGHYREFFDLVTELNAVAKAKGHREHEVWAPTVGQINRVVLVADYASLEEWQAESKAFQTDADCMKLWRQIGEHVELGARDELFESAYQIA